MQQAVTPSKHRIPPEINAVEILKALATKPARVSPNLGPLRYPIISIPANLPRYSVGIVLFHKVVLNIPLIASKAPDKAKKSKISQSELDKPNPIMATPHKAAATAIALPS